MTLTCGFRLRLRGGRWAGIHPSVTYNLYIKFYVEYVRVLGLYTQLLHGLYVEYVRVLGLYTRAHLYGLMWCIGEGERTSEKIVGVGVGYLWVKRSSAVSSSTPSRS